MGGSTEQKTSYSNKTDPWSPTIPGLQALAGGITGQIPNAAVNGTEQGALAQLRANAAAGNPYAMGIGGLATDLLNGGGANNQAGAIQGYYDRLNSNLSGLTNPLTNPSGYNPANNPAMRGLLDTITNDVTGQINGQFAGAGRDLSGMNQQALARGLSQGLAAPLLSQYNQDISNAIGASNALYSGGNTTSGLLSGLNQQSLANRQAGVDASSAALQARDSGANQQLAVEQQARGLPLQNYSMYTQALAPLAQLGQQTSGQQTTTSSQPLGQQILGGLLGGVGLLGNLGGFGPTGWLYGSGRGAAGLLNGLFSR